MTGAYVLLAVFITTGSLHCVTEAGKLAGHDAIDDDASYEVDARGALDFGLSILCQANYRVNPLRYNNYGCYCGFGGQGNPRDCVDQCCKIHDECYAAVQRRGVCPLSDFSIYVWPYVNYCRNVADCNVNIGECSRSLCRCDVRAAQCFQRNTYHPRLKNYNKALCGSGSLIGPCH